MQANEQGDPLGAILTASDLLATAVAQGVGTMLVDNGKFGFIQQDLSIVTRHQLQQQMLGT